MVSNRGTPQANVDTTFSNRLRELSDQAKKIQNAHQGKHQRIWQIPNDYSGSVMDVPNLHEPAFNRAELNSKYSEITRDPATAGTVGDVVSIKLQIDYNACEERAFRARHTSLCRAMCLSHGRRSGQGHGNIWAPKKGIENEVASFIAAGGV